MDNPHRYNQYTYYNMKKHIIKLRYEEKKAAKKNEVKDNFAEDYFKKNLWQNDSSINEIHNDYAAAAVAKYS